MTDNESTNEENLITFVENAQTGTVNHGLEMDGHLTYNPSTGIVTSNGFKPIFGGQANIIFTNSGGQLCFGMDGNTSSVVFKLDDEDGQPIFTFSEEGGTAILDGGDTDVTSHKPFIANSTITVGDGDLVLGSTCYINCSRVKHFRRSNSDHIRIKYNGWCNLYNKRAKHS